jgi:hypothetical protein
MRKPRKEDLTPWAQRQMDTAYRERERPKCSREDFEDGYLAALVYANVFSSFLIDKRPELFGS